MPAVQSRLDRIVSPERQSRLDRIPGGQTKPNFSLTREPVSSLDVPRQDSLVDIGKEMGHGAIEGFAKLPEAIGRIQQIVPTAIGKAAGLEKDSVFQRSLLALFSGIPGQPPSAHELAQRISPLTEAQHETTATQAGNVLGGLAQLPILGPMGPAATSLAMGVQSGMSAYDEVKANKGSEADAWKAAALQGGLSALATRAMIGIATKFNVNSGGILARIGKNVAAGVPVGAVEQTLSNGLTRYTGEKDRELWTGLKGRAATDAAVGLLMAALFPGHPVPERIQKATAKVELHGPVPDVQLAGMEGVKAVQKPQAATTPEPTPTPAEQPVVEQAKPQAVDPLEKVVQDMTLTQLRIRNLEGQSRVAKQKGQVEKGFRIDKELLGLGQKLRAHAQEFQDLAAERRGPEASGERPASVQQGAAAAEIPAESALSGVQPASSEAVQPTAEPAPVAEPRQASAESAREAAPQPQPTADTELHQALGDPSWRSELESMAKQAGGEAGGQVWTDLATGERGRTRGGGYTEWWADRPGSMSKAEIQSMVAKLVKAPEGTVPDFTQRQLTMLEYMLHNTPSGRETGRAAQEAFAAQEHEAELAQQRAAFEEANPGKEVPEALLPESATSFDPGTWEADLSDAIVVQGVKPPVAEHYVKAVQKISDELGEPPGPPKPPVPAAEMPEPGDPQGSDLIQRWIGEKQLAHAEADILGGKWRKALDKTLEGGFGKIARIAKERFGSREKRARALVEEAGQLEIDLRGKLDEEYAKYGSDLTPEQRAVLERRAALSPGQRAVIDDVILHNAELGQAAQDAEVISDHFDIYTKRIWKGDQSREAQPRTPVGPAKFATFTTGALPRSYSSILEGWAVGNDLKVKSFVDAAVLNRKIIADVVKNRNLVNQGLKAGTFRTVNPGEGWKQIEHPNFRAETIRAKIAAPDSAETLRDALSGQLHEQVTLDEAVKVYGRAREGKTSIVVGRDMRIIPRGDDIVVMQKLPLFARNEDARIINNVLGRSAITEYFEQGTKAGSVLSAIDKFSIVSKTMMTASIQDNMVFTALRNFRALPAETPADLIPMRGYVRGQKMIQAMHPDLQKGVAIGGLTFKPHADVAQFFELEKGRISKALDQNKITGGPKAFIENAYVDLNNFLYGKYIPAYKAQLYTLELARLRKFNHEKLMTGAMSDDALVKAAAQLSNNVFGGQNWQRQGTNPTAMHGAQFLVFAPDRMTSTLRLAADAFRAGATGQAHRVLWSRMMSRYVLMWAAVNFASAWADDPEHPIQDFAKRAKQNYGVGLREFFGFDIGPLLQRAGRNNPSRLYVDITGQSNEVAELVNDPLGYLGRKAGVVPRIVGSALFTGEDFHGRSYTTAAELTGTDDKGYYKTTELPGHVEGQKKGGRLAGQISSYQSDAKPGHIRYEQMPSFMLGHIPIPLETEAWIEVMKGQTDAWDASLQGLGFRTMKPSAKRQIEAGIKLHGPIRNLETLIR